MSEETKKPDELTIMRSARTLLEKLDTTSADRVIKWLGGWNNGRAAATWVADPLQKDEDPRQVPMFGGNGQP